MRYFLTLLCLLPLLFACENTEPAQQSDNTATLGDQLLGTWENTDVLVEMPTYLGGDTTATDEIREGDWIQRYGAQPTRTVFTEDHKFVRLHRLAAGSETNRTNGLWNENGDTLIFIEPNMTTNYHAAFSGNRLTLTGKVDWDQDGERDDLYRGEFRLVGRTAE